MDVNDLMSSASNLFADGKFTESRDLLQRTVDNCHLKKITSQDEIEFIVLRNNLLVCNCLRILSITSAEYTDRMTEFINVSKLYLYEKHIPLELRVNFMCNILHWYWLKPADVPDYCYDEIITLVNECLHEVLYEKGKNIMNFSSLIGKEEDILHSLECLSNGFLTLEPILVVQCLEISQILLLVFLFRRIFTSLLVNFTKQFIDQIKIILCAFKQKKCDHVTNCFKLGLSKINGFLDIEHFETILLSAHVSLCIKDILDNQYPQALCTLSTVDQHLNADNELLCLVYYLKALANFNLEKFEATFYYLAQMTNCVMEPFIKSRYYLLLGQTHSKVSNIELAISTFEKLKDSEFNNIMAYYLSQHYELNDMQFTQMLVLEQAIQENLNNENDGHKDFFISYKTRILMILHPQPDMTRRQLMYLAAKKKFEHSNYKLAATAYSNLLKVLNYEECVSDLVKIPSIFMLKHEAVISFLKAHQMQHAFELCQSLIEGLEPGCGVWKSDSYWAEELNSYNFNVVGAMLLAETGFNSDIVLEALNRSYNCLYAKVNCDYLVETNGSNENVKTLRKNLIGKVLLLKAMVLSKLDKEEECEASFQKALTYNKGDEDIVYLYSKWLEYKGKISQSMDVREQFDRNKTNVFIEDNIVLTYILENKHDIEDTMINTNVIEDLFISPDENIMDANIEMDPADDDIFNDLFLD